MKIKCPICVNDLPYTSNPNKQLPEYENVGELTLHWTESHVERVYRRYYARLLFKIHEKIAELEPETTGAYGETERRIIQELESLLEDEK